MWRYCDQILERLAKSEELSIREMQGRSDTSMRIFFLAVVQMATRSRLVVERQGIRKEWERPEENFGSSSEQNSSAGGLSGEFERWRRRLRSKLVMVISRMLDEKFTFETCLSECGPTWWISKLIGQSPQISYLLHVPPLLPSDHSS